jgi:ribosomal protein S8
MVTDPIADFLTRIRNAQMAGHACRITSFKPEETHDGDFV